MEQMINTPELLQSVSSQQQDDSIPLVSPFSQYFFPHHPPHKRLKIDNSDVSLLDYSTTTLTAMKKAWSSQDEAKLLEVVTSNTQGLSTSVNSANWNEITQNHLTKFSTREVLSHYCNVVSPHINRQPWTVEEEKSLLRLIEKYEEREWSCIASELGTGRTPFSCLQHYQQTLNRRLVNAEEWTPEEDALLRKAMEEHSGKSNGQLVADMVPFRTVSQCFNRWHKLSQRDKSSSDWNVEEERLLYLAVVAHDIPCMLESCNDTKEDDKKAPRGHKWQSVAKLMAKKDDVQCREKWTNNLDPTINSSPFTKTEDQLLTNLVDKHGTNNWSTIADSLPGRTDAMVRVRWARLHRASGSTSLDIHKKTKALPRKHSRSVKAVITESEFSKKQTIE